MSKNQNTEGPARSNNQNNIISDDPRDGNRNTNTLKKPAETAPGTQDQDQIEEFGRRGSAQGLAQS